MNILAIDPGNETSAWVFMSHGVVEFDMCSNHDMIKVIKEWAKDYQLLVEYTKSYTMKTKRGVSFFPSEVLDTALWVGRFVQAYNKPDFQLIDRRTVNKVLCDGINAGDSIVRAKLIDIYGGKEKAIGKKKTPGPLYGMKADMWAALAVAVTYQRMREEK